MKTVLFFIVSFTAAVCAAAETRTPAKTPSVSQDMTTEKAKEILDKQPKSLFLIKRAKINGEVGGPQFYPVEAQLRTLNNDSTLHNYKKFE